ncbi:MAG: AAA family ATPase [Prevotellaceae bacterium]|jgi:predicted AAA+ superfamily ATPase|nr:AAA family ATPase [Prevotellaceae bacterium]
MYQRKQIFEGAGNESVFFWGARQTGKSTLLKQLFPDALWFDLLLTVDYERLLKNPGLIREIVAANPSVSLVVIDEIQRLPALLNEIHWLIANKNIRFIMSGSSPRKILRSGANLLGGRALRYELYPLTSSEIPDFDLLKALNNGLLPKHYDTPNAKRLLSAYIGSYLRDEIAAEAQLRNIAVFSRFLEIAALTNGEVINYSNVATDTGVSVPTVKAYFQILEDTLLGRCLPAFQKRPKRRMITAPKFYLFDVGIVNTLLNRGRIEPGTELFGKSFEHFIYEEIHAHSSYSGLNYPLAYWRTTSQLEIDFVLGDHEVAIEVKSTSEAQPRHWKGLQAFAEEYPVKKLILVSNDAYPRRVNNIWILPWQTFLQQLWSGEIIS